MDFIRSEKARSDYDPNTRHCLYGLDADLIMLGLTTHEPHFALLREEVRFGKQTQKRYTQASFLKWWGVQNTYEITRPSFCRVNGILNMVFFLQSPHILIG